MSTKSDATSYPAKIRKLYLKLFRSIRSDEQKLQVVKAYGTFAMQNNTGNYREDEFETFLSSYGKKHLQKSANPAKLNDDVLIHVITRTYEIGGHSRFLENLLLLDDRHVHHLIVTDQGAFQPRKSIYSLIEKKGGTISILEGELKKKCGELLELVSKTEGKIILHHHPDDLIPSIALSQISATYPVFLFNHADHCYSFGFELDPTVINIRDEAARISAHRRFCKKNVVLPLPIVKPVISETRAEVFERYGLDSTLKLGLCIGGMHKMMPFGEYNFFRTMQKALVENENLQIAFVGITREKFNEFGFITFDHPRFHFLGIINDPSELQAHADIALDPIPFGSYTADLETIAYGAYPLGTYNNPPLFDLTNDPALNGKYTMPESEREYLDQLKYAVNEHGESDRKALIESMHLHHFDSNWMRLLNTALRTDTHSYAEYEAIDDSYTPPYFQQKKEKIKHNLILLVSLSLKEISFVNSMQLYFRLVAAGISVRTVASLIKNKRSPRQQHQN